MNLKQWENWKKEYNGLKWSNIFISQVFSTFSWFSMQIAFSVQIAIVGSFFYSKKNVKSIRQTFEFFAFSPSTAEMFNFKK